MFRNILQVCGLIVLLVCYTSFLNAQTNPVFADSGQMVVQEKSQFHEDRIRIFPLALFTVAAIYRHNSIIVSKYEVQKFVTEQAPGFNNHAEDILQYVPAALPFALDLFKVKSRTPTGKRTLMTAEALILGTTASSILKNVFDDVRPNGVGHNAFPSGHTTFAFAGAAILAKEYGRKYPWIKWTGYGIAATAGVFRMLNNAHWLSDVMGGAALGMFSVDAVYFLNNSHIFKKKDRKVVNPLQSIIRKNFEKRAIIICEHIDKYKK